jgi:hypothetical protein
MLNPIKWLLTKSEPATRETTMTDTTATDTATTATVSDPAPVTEATPASEVKAGVKDFEAAFTFVEHGIAQLGEAAKDELKALAQKYL